jgi:hypothetical protein
MCYENHFCHTAESDFVDHLSPILTDHLSPIQIDDSNPDQIDHLCFLSLISRSYNSAVPFSFAA